MRLDTRVNKHKTYLDKKRTTKNTLPRVAGVRSVILIKEHRPLISCHHQFPGPKLFLGSK
jgi:hypothetical protein